MKSKITLKYPVDMGGQPVVDLVMRRPKVKDVLAASRGGQDRDRREVALLATLCTVPQSFIEELDMADYRRLQDELECMETGESDPTTPPTPES
jgi:hypothetical protein